MKIIIIFRNENCNIFFKDFFPKNKYEFYDFIFIEGNWTAALENRNRKNQDLPLFQNGKW